MNKRKLEKNNLVEEKEDEGKYTLKDFGNNQLLKQKGSGYGTWKPKGDRDSRRNNDQHYKNDQLRGVLRKG